MAGPAIQEPVEEAPPAPRDDPDDLLRSIEEQLSQFERRVRSDVFMAEDETSEPEAEAEDVDWSGGHREVEPEAAPEPRDWQEPEPEAPRTEYRFRGPAGPGWNRDVEPESEAEDFAEPSYAPRSTAEETERAALFGRDLSESDDTDDDRADFAEEARRRIAGEPGLRGTFAGGGAAAASSDARDFASLEAELSRELDTGAYAGTGTGAYADRHATEDDVAGTDSDDDVPIAPAAVIAPEHGMRPPPPRPASAAAPAPRRFRPGWGMIAAAVVVLAAGAAVAVYVRSFDQAPSGPPPVIAAPDGPVKIEPAADETASGEETVGEAVYDRVAGEGSQTQETLVDGAEEPQELARIVPPSAESDAQMAPATDDTAMMPAQDGEDTMAAVGSSDSGAAPAPAIQQAAEEDFGPRQVQTYVVRADGSIVTTEEAGGQPQQPDLSAQQLASAQTEAVEPTPVQTVVIDKPQVAGSSVTEETTMSPAPAASAPSTDTGGATAEAPMEPEATETPSEPATDLAELRTAEEPAPEAPAPEATQSAATEEPAAAAVPATATSGYVVQLSATGSPEEAQTTYSRLQRNYASILGNLEANIQRADLGDRGIFYRVRVGPWAQRGDAVAVCESLKAAGADCFVTQ
jgi:cell division septation protein DedD